jgi:hypothetical protein
MVVYRNLGDGKIWVRPKSMFFDIVKKDGYEGPRFKPAGLKCLFKINERAYDVMMLGRPFMTVEAMQIHDRGDEIKDGEGNIVFPEGREPSTICFPGKCCWNPLRLIFERNIEPFEPFTAERAILKIEKRSGDSLTYEEWVLKNVYTLSMQNRDVTIVFSEACCSIISND